MEQRWEMMMMTTRDDVKKREDKREWEGSETQHHEKQSHWIEGGLSLMASSGLATWLKPKLKWGRWVTLKKERIMGGTSNKAPIIKLNYLSNILVNHPKLNLPVDHNLWEFLSLLQQTKRVTLFITLTSSQITRTFSSTIKLYSDWFINIFGEVQNGLLLCCCRLPTNH
jgi:hypothetical protein